MTEKERQETLDLAIILHRFGNQLSVFAVAHSDNAEIRQDVSNYGDEVIQSIQCVQIMLRGKDSQE